jgi:hypothetical protein
VRPLFPYKTLFGDVKVSVPEVRIDGLPIPNRVDVDQRVIDLSRLERADWETAAISVVVDAPPAEMADALNPVCMAVINCGPTNTRSSTVLDQHTVDIGRWTGVLHLERPYWYAQAAVRCGVVASVEGTDHRLIGWGDAWTISFDDLPSRPVNGAIKITWVNFSSPGDDKQYLRRHTDSYLYLSLDQDEPQIFLNQGFEGLEQLLADRRRRGADKALHDQARAAIADKTWAALFNTALAAVQQDDVTRESTWPDIEWQRAVLEVLLPRMYPAKTLDEALQEAWSSRNAADNPGTLQEHLALASAVQSKANRLLRDGIRAISFGPSAADEESDA